MGHGIYTAAAGAIARRNQLDITANNLANVTTTGFRTQRVTFREVLQDQNAPTRHVVSIDQSVVSTNRGPIERTGRALDLALGDEAFLVAEGIGRRSLLRSVSAHVADDGSLQDSSGRTLATVDGATRVNPSLPLFIGEHGQLQQEGREVGQLLIVSVADPRALQPVGDGTYLPTVGSGQVRQITGRVETGALEKSNVNVVSSMVRLIQLERDFQSLTRVIHAYREADDGIIGASIEQ